MSINSRIKFHGNQYLNYGRARKMHKYKARQARIAGDFKTADMHKKLAKFVDTLADTHIKASDLYKKAARERNMEALKNARMLTKKAANKYDEYQIYKKYHVRIH